VLAKHTKQISLGDVLSIGIDRIHRNFEPIQKQVGACFESDTPRGAGGLVSGAASKAVVPLVEAAR